MHASKYGISMTYHGIVQVVSHSVYFKIYVKEFLMSLAPIVCFHRSYQHLYPITSILYLEKENV